MLKASCLDNGWSRFIRAKATAKLSTEAVLVSVLTPNKIIEAGKRVTAQDIEVTQLPPNRTPQGSISSLKQSAQWFSLRTMRPGHIITRKDLAEPREVLVVTRALPAGTLLTAKAVRIEQRAANVPRDALTSTANLANLAASKLLHPGDILRKRDLTKGKLIRRGEKVALLSQGLSYAISSEVVALEDGFLGEQVRLLNTESQRRVSAIVTGPSRAKTLATKW
jgi:flagella basal body P-ring formation protein FlgA